MKHPDGIEVYLKPAVIQRSGFSLFWNFDSDDSDDDEVISDLENESEGNNDDEEQDPRVLQEKRQTREAIKQRNRVRRQKEAAKETRQAEKARARREETKKRQDEFVKLRLPELVLRDDDPFRKRCYVPELCGGFEVVLRFSKDFDMSSADTIHYGVTHVVGDSQLYHFNQEQCSRIPGQQITVSEGWFESTWIHFEGTFALRAHAGDFRRFDPSGKNVYDYKAEPGTILVFVTRGFGAWRTKSPGDPSIRRPFKNGRFHRMNGDIGKSYVFEFCPRSHDSIREDEKHLKATEPALQNALNRRASRNFRFIKDDEYEENQAQTKRIRKEMHTAWIKKNAWRYNIKRNPGPRSILAARAQQPKSIPSTAKPLSNAPLLCDCPTNHRKISPTSDNAPLSRSGAQTTQSKKAQHKDGSIEDGNEEEGTTHSKVQANNTTKETLARTCGQCKKYKRAPRGKKITYRERTGKYMYVHKDAPEEDNPAAEEDEDDQSQGEDRDGDDEEPLPKTKPESDGGDGDRLDPEDADIVHVEESGDGMIAAEMETGDVVATTNDVTNGGPETSIAGAEDHHAASGAAAKNAQTTAGIEATKDNESQSLFVEQTGSLTRDAIEAEATSAAAAAAADQPATPPETPLVGSADSESKKRPNGSEPEAPVSKKARIDIDLTVDDDDDLVVVMSEHAQTVERSASSPEDDEALRHKLEQLRRRKQILEIEVEEAEIKRKLAKGRGRGRSMVKVEDEAIIKIED